VFGASKAAADLMVQEYGRYFGLRTAVFRCGCIAGPSHQGARQHGFLSYLVRCAREGRPYTIYGYRGKQVRDNLHVSDLIAAFDAFYKNPKDGGAVYNMGGSRVSNTSILEAITWIENAGKARMRITFEDTPRVGDHRWYVSDVGKFQRDYPAWLVTRTTEQIIEDLWV
jgi:CDP-paratose 2-epimerase